MVKNALTLRGRLPTIKRMLQVCCDARLLLICCTLRYAEMELATDCPMQSQGQTPILMQSLLRTDSPSQAISTPAATSAL